MNAEVFIDTNVFLYSLSDDPGEKLKAERAREILLNENWGWSVQVAGEFFTTATSLKRQFRLPRSLAREYVDTWLTFPTAALNSQTVREALMLVDVFQISYWDASIIASASALGCRRLYSEDLSDGQNYDGVQVINPFPTQGNK